jgi:hypothetical protein
MTMTPAKTARLKKTTALAALLGLTALSLFMGVGAFAQADPPKKVSKAKVAPSTKPAAANPAGKSTVVPEGPTKRDPFSPLIDQHKDSASGIHLPPGKAGLVVATVRIDGTIHSQGGMIAIVSNPEQHVYFIREGDRLYDGDVEKIGLDGVTFRENSKDAFGKPIERVVTKRIYASAGEQQ